MILSLSAQRSWRLVSGRLWRRCHLASCDDDTCLRTSRIVRNARRKRVWQNRYAPMALSLPPHRPWWRRRAFRTGWIRHRAWIAQVLDGTACRVLARSRARMRGNRGRIP